MGDTAEGEFDKAQIRSKDVDGLRSKCYIRNVAGKYNLQEDLLKAVTLRSQGKRQESFDAFLKLATQLEEDGFDAKAAAVATQALQTIRCPEAYAKLAAIQCRRGFIAAALQALADAYALCMERGNREQAETYLQQKHELELQLSGDNASSTAYAAEMDADTNEEMEAALLHFIIGDIDGAIKALEPLATQSATQVDACYMLAKAWAYRYLQTILKSENVTQEQRRIVEENMAVMSRNFRLPSISRRIKNLWR